MHDIKNSISHIICFIDIQINPILDVLQAQNHNCCSGKVNPDEVKKKTHTCIYINKNKFYMKSYGVFHFVVSM